MVKEKTKTKSKTKESYGKNWKHAYRKVNNKVRPVLVSKVNGKEIIKVPSEGYVKKHHPRGPWDS
jgi:hypothetical protein